MFLLRARPSRTIVLSLALSPPLAGAQTAVPSAFATVSRARASYYTPVDDGLQSFHCEIGFDWKKFLEQTTKQEVPDTDPRLSYLHTIQLSVDDDLRSGGELHWNAPKPAPEGTEDSINGVRSGFQEMWSAFFQSWNGYATGDLMIPDAHATVEHSPGGYRVAVQSASGTAEEQFDEKLVLRSVHVSKPSLDSLMQPTFSPTPQGLVVTGIYSTYKQPPTSPATVVLMKITYANVDRFQLPTELVIEVASTSFAFHLGSCTVKTALTQK